MGLRVIFGVTVKSAEAELSLASVTSIVCAPAVEAGTVRVAPEKEPVASVVVVPLRVTEEPPNVAVIVEDAAKPVPLMDTVSPTFPLVGLKVISGSTVNVAEPVLVPSEADTA